MHTHFKTITAGVIALTTLLSVVLAFTKNLELPLMPIVLLGLLYVSMIRKWRQLSEENLNTARASVAIHVLAMVVLVVLIFTAFLHTA